MRINPEKNLWTDCPGQGSLYSKEQEAASASSVEIEE